MEQDNLQSEFRKAVAYISNYTDPLAPDLLLKLYAYYKIANENYDNPGSKTPLINAFKANALIQAKNLRPEEAMEKYIILVKKEFGIDSF
jgi:acyl-CoA-binding protein